MEIPYGVGEREAPVHRVLRIPIVVAAALTAVSIKLFKLNIRFGQLWSERLGHLAGNTEVYLCERDHGFHPGYHVWFHRTPISCIQMAIMYERVLNIGGPFWKFVRLVSSWLWGPEKFMVSSHQVDRDIHNLLERYPPHIGFNQQEEELGQAKLREWGIPVRARIVCVIVRDGAYLPTHSYHSYRDTKVETYIPAMKALAELGYYVFRMGAKVEKALGPVHARVFDYATNGMLTDFMTVYLGAKCAFCLSNGCGFDAIPVVFRRPIVYVNYVPVEYLQTYNKGSLAIWKHHYKDGKRMSFEEIIKSGAGQFMTTEQFEKAGIVLQDNSPEEIRDVALEMALGPAGKSQDEFWKRFPRAISPYNGRPLHGAIRMRIGSKFLESYEPTKVDSPSGY